MGPIDNIPEKFVADLSHLEDRIGSAGFLTEVFRQSDEEQRRSLADSIDGLVAEASRLDQALSRMGILDLPNVMSIDSPNIEAVLGYSDARRIVATLPKEFKSLTQESYEFMQQMQRTFEEERLRSEAARDASQRRHAQLLDQAVSAMEQSSDPTVLQPSVQLAQLMSALDSRHWQTVSDVWAAERDIYLTFYGFQIRQSLGHRLRLWWGRTALRLIQVAVAVVFFFGVGVVGVNALSSLFENWWTATAVSAVGALFAGALATWGSNRFLGRAKGRQIRILSGSFVRARAVLIGARAAGKIFANRQPLEFPADASDRT
jgi:hypothetical protein